jgi:hypothetical protein
VPDDLTRLLGKFDEATIRAMGDAKSGQLGLGGVGVHRVRILKAQGVGHTLVIFDMDRVTDPCKGLLDQQCGGMLKTQATADQFKPVQDYWPHLEAYALNVVTDLGDYAMWSFEFNWFADCGDNDLCSLALGEQFQRIGGGTVLQRVRGEGFRAAVWVCRDLNAACFGCAMNATQRADAHHIHSCTRVDPARSERHAAALVATQTAAAAHGVQEEWLLQRNPQARPANYTVRFDAETGSSRVVALRRDPNCPHHPEPIPWHNVQVLQNAETRSVRPLDLMEEVHSEVMVLDRSLVLLMACQACDARLRLEPPVTELVLMTHQVGCPVCGGDLRSLLSSRRVSRHSRTSRHTLFDLGMPFGHVYRFEGNARLIALADHEAELQRSLSETPQRTWNLQIIGQAEAAAAWMTEEVL